MEPEESLKQPITSTASVFKRRSLTHDKRDSAVHIGRHSNAIHRLIQADSNLNDVLAMLETRKRLVKGQSSHHRSGIKHLRNYSSNLAAMSILNK